MLNRQHLSDMSEVSISLWKIVVKIPRFAKIVLHASQNEKQPTHDTTEMLFHEISCIRESLLHWQKIYESTVKLFTCAKALDSTDSWKQREPLVLYMTCMMLLDRLLVVLRSNEGRSLEEEGQTMAEKFLYLQEVEYRPHPRAQLFMLLKNNIVSANTIMKFEWELLIREQERGISDIRPFDSTRSALRRWWRICIGDSNEVRKDRSNV